LKKLEQQLGLAGIGKNKNSSELELLRKNVDELTQMIRLRDFEIKKLKNQNIMTGNVDNDNSDLKEKSKNIRRSTIKDNKRKFTKQTKIFTI